MEMRCEPLESAGNFDYESAMHIDIMFGSGDIVVKKTILRDEKRTMNLAFRYIIF